MTKLGVYRIVYKQEFTVIAEDEEQARDVFYEEGGELAYEFIEEVYREEDYEE